MCQKKLNPEGVHNPNIHFLAGAVAGGVACAVTMPLDVCKTLLNTQESAASLNGIHLKRSGQLEAKKVAMFNEHIFLSFRRLACSAR